MPSNHLILCHPSPPALNLSQNQGLFQWVGSFHIRWPKYWSFSISPSKEYSRLISCRIDWFDFLALQGTLKSLLQLHSSKVSTLWCSAFFMPQLSHPCKTTGKTIALTIQTFAGKVMSLLFNMLSSFVMGFPGGSEGKESACNTGDLGSVPGIGRSSGGGQGNPLQYSGLENPLDRGVWWAPAHGVPKSWGWLSD